MSKVSHLQVVLLGLFGAVSVQASAIAEDARLNIIACPLVRDTHLPCWLAEHQGELYYLGPQGDLGAPFYPPQLGHKALIEGVVTDQRICGGVVLEPVQVSVLPEVDRSCNSILPAEGYPDPPNHRGPGPSGNLDDYGKPPELQSIVEREPQPPAPALTGEQSFPVYFSFDVGERVFSRNSRPVSQALRYAQESGGRVQVTGYRGATLLSSGELIPERREVAEVRARMVENMLVGAGLDPSVLTVEWSDEVVGGDGADDYLDRRAVVTVTP